MEAQRSDHRSASVQRSNLRSIEFPDVHAGLRASGQHAAAAPVLANATGIHGEGSWPGAYARRFHDYLAVAVGGVSSVALHAAVASATWLGHTVVLVISHDGL